MNKRNIFFVLVITIMSLVLVSCGGQEDTIQQAEEEVEVNTNLKDEPIIVALASGGSTTEVFNVAKEVLENQGYTIETQVYNDYNSPNTAVEEGEADCNYYQHKAFLKNYNESNGTNLVQAGQDHTRVIHGIYSDKIDSIDDIEDGMTVAIQNDASNMSASLKILDDAGIIELNDPEKNIVMVTDIKENPYNLEFIEMDEPTIPNAMKDVDIGCVMSSQWKSSGRDPEEAILQGSMDSSTVILVTSEGNEDSEKCKIVDEALRSQEVKDFINDKYGGIIEPLF